MTGSLTEILVAQETRVSALIDGEPVGCIDMRKLDELAAEARS
mgnify:CR=1 FL=1